MKNVPKLRFKGFNDEWQENTIAKLFDVSAGGDISKEHICDERNSIFKYPIYANSLTNRGLYGYSDIYKVSGETITVTGRGVNIGVANARYDEYYPIVRLLVLVPQKELNIKFFEEIINNTEIFIESTGVPQLTGPQISKLRLKYPIIKEQIKIANFLTKVDKIIEKQEEKVNNLEQYKKGMMQKLFSQEIRFKKDDGGEYPNWKISKLGDACDIVGGGTPSTTEQEFWNGSVQWFTPSEIKENKYVKNSTRTITELGVKKSSAKILPKGTILLTTRATLGEMAILTCEATTNQGFQSLIVKEGISNEFIYYMKYKIKKYCYINSSGSTFLEISKSSLEKFRFFIPCYEEQIKIANFLSKIDSIVDKEKAKLKELRQWKKGLLQKMFV